MAKQLILDDLLTKQERLMELVPHTVRPDAAVKMRVGLKVIDVLMRFLNSTGHKPWRPTPLSPLVQQSLFSELENNVNILGYVHSTNAGADQDFSASEADLRKMISAFGIIEESVEYMNSVFNKDGDDHKLEELVDMYFFLLEQTAMSGFTLEQVEIEYHRKWLVNIKRYEDGAKGDYKWDKRDKEVL